MKNTLLATTAMFALLSGAAIAEPKNGFGLNAGAVNHKRDCGGCTVSTTSGMSIGVDYQFALSSSLSISPFLMSSSETNKNVPGDTVGHGILGGQLRYWIGDLFLGGHLGNYSEVIRSGGVTVASGAGGGAGLVAGWEDKTGGLYVMGQVDSATVKFTSGFSGSIPINAFRLSLGYRWK